MTNPQILQLKQRVTQLTQAKHYKEALATAVQLVKLNPNDIESWFALAQLQEYFGEIEAAVKSLYQVCRVKSPIYVVAVERLVRLCIGNGLYDKALEPAQVWQKLKPDHAEANFQLGTCLMNLGKCVEAITYFEAAIKLHANAFQYWRSLGIANMLLANHQASREAFEKALEIIDDGEAGRINLYGLNNFEALTEEEVVNAHKQYASRFEQAHEATKLASKKVEGRRIRVGYLSQDFTCHSVSFFFRAVIESHAKDRFEVFCYSDVKKPDHVTEELKASSEHWRDTRALDDKQLHAQIQEDQIDILVDLVGYVGKCRLGVFAMRAAPVQVSYLGYPNTTGLNQMDFRLTDSWADPEGMTEQYYTETLARLPGGFLCYTPDKNIPDVSQLPALENDKQVCFGSFNSFQKVTDKVIKLWAAILLKVPSSRLFMKAKPFQEERARESVFKRFEALGVDRSRLELVGLSPYLHTHLELYGKVDIHLDTFPYNGTTTTCEALWQGVPTVCLEGGVHRSRVGVSIMKSIGLDEFIAATEEEYVQLAVNLANDLDRLSELRAGLRKRLQNSSLMDRQRFIKELERSYEAILMA